MTHRRPGARLESARGGASDAPLPSPQARPTLESFDLLQFPHDRFRVVLMDAQLGDGPRSAEPDVGYAFASNRSSSVSTAFVVGARSGAGANRVQPNHAIITVAIAIAGRRRRWVRVRVVRSRRGRHVISISKVGVGWRQSSPRAAGYRYRQASSRRSKRSATAKSTSTKVMMMRISAIVRAAL